MPEPDLSRLESGQKRRFSRSSESFRRYWVYLVLLVVAANLPLWVPDDNRNFLLGLGIIVMLTALGGMSFNLLGGYAGQVSFGQASFYGISAYAFALLFSTAHLNNLLAMFLAALVSSVVCIPIGFILFRLRGAYFALSMLAFAEVVRLLALEDKALTNGAAGILFFSPYAEKSANYWLLLIILVVCMIGVTIVVRSKLGSYFLAIREDPEVAEALGINTTMYKLLAFIPSSFLMGLAGAFYASYYAYLEPSIVFNSLNVSLNVLIVVLIGGTGTLLGPIVGAAILVLTTQVFVTYFGQGNILMSGVILILFILFLPEGVVGRSQRILDQRRARRHARAETAA